MKIWFHLYKKTYHHSIFLYGVMMLIGFSIFMPAHAEMINSPVEAKITNSNDKDMKDSFYDVKAKNGQIYRIFEAVPSKPAPKTGWPVIYLLDGNATYPLAKAQNPDAIIIGIGYPTEDKDEIVQRRYFDLTTKTSPENIPLKAGAQAPITGGEHDFRAFIIDELMPDINQRLPNKPNQATLFGHSLGGIFSLRTLVETPNAFQTICAIDPSIWWDKHAFIKELQTFTKAEIMPSLLIETAGKKVQKPNSNPDDAQKVKALRSGPNGQDVAKILASDKYINVLYRNFSDESHGTVIKPAVNDCLALTLNQNNPQLQFFKPNKL